MTALNIFNKFGLLGNDKIWLGLERNVLKSLHKIKTSQLAYTLDLFEKFNLGTTEFFVRLTTILPIHVEFLSLKEFTRLFEICLIKNLGKFKI